MAINDQKFKENDIWIKFVNIRVSIKRLKI